MPRRDGEAWAKWRRLVSEQQRSGLSVAAFCRERGLRAPRFFAWKKRLSQAGVAEFVRVRIGGAAEPQPQAATAGRAIEIRLRGQRSVVVEPG
jgi:hypothetical protein